MKYALLCIAAPLFAAVLIVCLVTHGVYLIACREDEREYL